MGFIYSPPAVPQVDAPAIRTAFAKFARRDGLMDNRGFAKLCKEYRLHDKDFKAPDTDIIFAKVKPSHARKVGIDAFELALLHIARKKNVDLEAVHKLLGVE